MYVNLSAPVLEPQNAKSNGSVEMYSVHIYVYVWEIMYMYVVAWMCAYMHLCICAGTE